MKRTLVRALGSKVSEQVKIKGFIHKKRDLGKITFLILRERSGLVQVVVEEAKVIDDIKHLSIGSCLEIIGTVVEAKSSPGGIELNQPDIKILTAISEPMPIEINTPEPKFGLEVGLEHRALALRHERFAVIFKAKAIIAQAYREFMLSQECTEFFGPAMTAASSEGGTEVFKMPYFDGEATLTQSNQLYKQIMVGVYERVFGIAKWFRAENSHTRRHLTEGHQLEFEMGFIDNYSQVMDVLEAAIRFIHQELQSKLGPELEKFGFELPLISEAPFPRFTFAEVQEILKDKVSEDVMEWDDMTTEGEKALCEYCKEKYGCEFVLITNYLKGVFYAYKTPDGVFENFDLLCREAEIVSGGRRIANYEELKTQIEAAGMDPSDFSEYLSIFKYGMPPHGGFGIGLERLTMLMLGLENIREANIFPSDPKRIAGQTY